MLNFQIQAAFDECLHWPLVFLHIRKIKKILKRHLILIENEGQNHWSQQRNTWDWEKHVLLLVLKKKKRVFTAHFTAEPHKSHWGMYHHPEGQQAAPASYNNR